MINTLLKVIFCHLIGDYVLQSDYIAKTKGENLYHLIIHSMLYALPFYVVFGCDLRIFTLVVTHLVIDALKAKYKKINYTTDQVLHIGLAIGLYVVAV